MNKHQHEKQARATGWPFDGKHLWDDPAYDDSILNPDNRDIEDNSVPAGLPTDKGLPTRKQFRESEETWTKLNKLR